MKNIFEKNDEKHKKKKNEKHEKQPEKTMILYKIFFFIIKYLHILHLFQSNFYVEHILNVIYDNIYYIYI